MEYYFINTLGNQRDRDLCILDGVPEPTGMKSYKMAEGLPIASDYPSNASIAMSPHRHGIKLGSLIGNINSLLIVHKKVIDVIQQHCSHLPIEYLPFTLYNHKNRIHSTDYLVVNPIGTIDCLNHKESQIEYMGGQVVAVQTFVLDPERIPADVDLFRITEAPREYVVSQTLVDAFRQRSFTNIPLKKIRQHGEGGSN